MRGNGVAFKTGGDGLWKGGQKKKGSAGGSYTRKTVGIYWVDRKKAPDQGGVKKKRAHGMPNIADMREGRGGGSRSGSGNSKLYHTKESKTWERWGGETRSERQGA